MTTKFFFAREDDALKPSEYHMELNENEADSFFWMSKTGGSFQKKIDSVLNFVSVNCTTTAIESVKINRRVPSPLQHSRSYLLKSPMTSIVFKIKFSCEDKSGNINLIIRSGKRKTTVQEPTEQGYLKSWSSRRYGGGEVALLLFFHNKIVGKKAILEIV